MPDSDGDVHASLIVDYDLYDLQEEFKYGDKLREQKSMSS